MFNVESFSSQFPTETQFRILLVDSMPYEVCYFLVRGSPGPSLVMYPTYRSRHSPEMEFAKIENKNF